MTTPRILRKNEVCELTGLSKSTIDAKNKVGCKYYDPEFPQRFKLSKHGRAVGWYEAEIHAYIAKQGESKGDATTPSVPVVTKGRVGRPRKTASASIAIHAQSKAKRDPVKNTLAEDIGEGGNLVAHIYHYLKLPEWTPAMGFLLISGIAPPEGTTDLAALTDAKGLDDRPVRLTDPRIGAARHLLEVWEEWAETEDDVPKTLTPNAFLIWCWDNQVETPWLRLIHEVNSSGEEHSDPIRKAQFSLLMQR